MEKNVEKRKKFLDILKSNKLNARTLSERLGVPYDRIYKWVYGKGTPNPATMLKLAEILNVTEREILESFVY